MMRNDLLLRKNWMIKQKQGSIRQAYQMGKGKELGSGSFGTVELGVHKVTKQQRAIKKIPKHKVSEPQEFMKQIQILQKLDHPSIIKLYEIYEDDRYIYMVMELCRGGQLFDKIIEVGQFTENKAQALFREIMYALAYCHERGVAHRDLKPQNFLFSTKEITSPLKIIDFGLSFQFNKQAEPVYTSKKAMSTVVGTSYYMAPEILLGKYDHFCDIWSAGVILYILLSGVPPFDGENDAEILRKVQTGVFDFRIPEMKKVTMDAKDLISKMLIKQPQKRPTVKDVLAHPWLQRTNIPAVVTINFQALQQFFNSNKLKKIALTFIATQLSQVELSSLAQIFKNLDSNGDGVLTKQELKRGIKDFTKIGTDLDFSTVQAVIQALDTDKSGFIDYNQFVSACIDRSVYLREEHMVNAFKAIDLNNDGCINRSELKAMIESDPLLRNDEEYFASIINQADVNKDGVIDYHEFIAAMQKK